MEVISKQMFIELLTFKPQSLIGSQIIFENRPQRIIDVSLSGDYFFLDKGSMGKKWERAGNVGDEVVIDTGDVSEKVRNAKYFTVATLAKDIESLTNRVGEPDSKNSKPLFEIVSALSNEILVLKLKFEEIELKGQNYEYKEEKP